MAPTTYSRILRASPAFTSEASARRYASTAARPMWIVLGEGGRYLVCTPANASRLERAGLEIV